jgi:hypothetical protein
MRSFGHKWLRLAVEKTSGCQLRRAFAGGSDLTMVTKAMMKKLGLGLALSVAACSGSSNKNGATATATASSTGGGQGGAIAVGAGGGGSDAGGASAQGGGGGGGKANCLDEGHQAGERYSLKDNCNFCDCQPDGSSVCTQRSCPAKGPGCSYDNKSYSFGEKFPASDGVNECVCAASGLACTRRQQGLPEEGAILLESLTASCGDDAMFTGAKVLADLPANDISAPFVYSKMQPFPETFPDTNVRFRIVYDGGFVVCRLPSQTQPAIDMEVVVEWISEDGSFDEGHHTYLRRNNFGFLDAWFSNSTAASHNALDGTYKAACPNPKGMSFSAQVNADGTADGTILKTCEFDSAVPVGTFAYAP